MAQRKFELIQDFNYGMVIQSEGKSVTRNMPKELWDFCNVVQSLGGAFAGWAGYARAWLGIGKSYPTKVKRKNMTNLILCIASNLDLRTFTFCTAGTIAQYADKIGVDTSTVSRHLHDLIELGELEEAFPGDKASSNDPRAGLIQKPNLVDDNGQILKNTGVYLPRVLRVTNKFFERRCSEEAVNRIYEKHFREVEKTGLSVKELLLEVRDRVYGYAFKKHTERLSLKLGFRSSIVLKRCRTRDEAVALITRQIHKEYSKFEIAGMSTAELNFLVLRRLKASGWEKAPPG